MTADLDVVIVNHGTPDLCEVCVESLHNWMPPKLKWKLIVVDNSNSGAAYRDPEIETLYIQNLGYGNAVNIGVAHVGSAPNVLILNADTEMLPESNIQWMLNILNGKKVAVVGPKQINAKGIIKSAGCPPVDGGVGYTIRGWNELDEGQYLEDVLDCMYVAGSIILTRRDYFECLGGFLETPLYYEEAYYCYALRHFGYRVVYTGMSKWIHHWDSSPKDDMHLLSGRPVAIKSHGMFVEALKKIGYPEDEIPAFV